MLVGPRAITLPTSSILFAPPHSAYRKHARGRRAVLKWVTCACVASRSGLRAHKLQGDCHGGRLRRSSRTGASNQCLSWLLARLCLHRAHAARHRQRPLLRRRGRRHPLLGRCDAARQVCGHLKSAIQFRSPSPRRARASEACEAVAFLMMSQSRCSLTPLSNNASFGAKRVANSYVSRLNELRRLWCVCVRNSPRITANLSEVSICTKWGTSAAAEVRRRRANCEEPQLTYHPCVPGRCKFHHGCN